MTVSIEARKHKHSLSFFRVLLCTAFHSCAQYVMFMLCGSQGLGSKAVVLGQGQACKSCDT
jgi:hypothetical protein